MQVTFPMTMTQQTDAVTFLSPMNQMNNTLISEAIKEYYCRSIRDLQLFKL